jgi:hypothetical protein
LINFTWGGKATDFCRSELLLTMLGDDGSFLNYVANFELQIKLAIAFTLRNIKQNQQIGLYFLLLVTEFKVISSFVG